MEINPLVALLLLLAFTLTSANDLCGLPGKPRSGSINFFNHSHTVKYECDKDHWFVPWSNNTRRCVDGKWDNQVPDCVKPEPVSEIVYGNKTLRLEGLWCVKNWIRNGSFTFSMDKPRRIYAFRFETRHILGWKNQKNMLQVALQGHLDGQSEWLPLVVNERKNFQFRDVLFTIRDHRQFKGFRVVVNEPFIICAIDLMAFYDDCGSPEIPLNGNVEWNRGDSTATYHCDEHYTLDTDRYRQCVDGKWAGPEPRCVLDPKCDAPTKRTSLKAGKGYAKTSTGAAFEETSLVGRSSPSSAVKPGKRRGSTTTGKESTTEVMGPPTTERAMSTEGRTLFTEQVSKSPSQEAPKRSALETVRDALTANYPYVIAAVAVVIVAVVLFILYKKNWFCKSSG